MPFNLILLSLIFALTFAIYYFDVRKDCRWMAWLAAIAMTLTAGLIDRFVSDAQMGRFCLQIGILVMVAVSMPVRYAFGNKNAQRIVYRQHHIKAHRFLPW